jgi:hypothetical protein
MSGIRTSHPVAIIRAGNGIDMDAYASELHCVLGLINSGALGLGIDPRSIGWGSSAHREAIERVIQHCSNVKTAIVEQEEKDESYAKDVPHD